MRASSSHGAAAASPAGLGLGSRCSKLLVLTSAHRRLAHLLKPYSTFQPHATATSNST